jgi:hypothetical protein
MEVYFDRNIPNDEEEGDSLLNLIQDSSPSIVDRLISKEELELKRKKLDNALKTYGKFLSNNELQVLNLTYGLNGNKIHKQKEINKVLFNDNEDHQSSIRRLKISALTTIKNAMFFTKLNSEQIEQIFNNLIIKEKIYLENKYGLNGKKAILDKIFTTSPKEKILMEKVYDILEINEQNNIKK